MTAVSKSVYFDVLDNVVKKYNNGVHGTIKMKQTDVTSNSYAEYNEDSNEKDPKFKVGDRVRIWKYKNNFAKGYIQNWSEEVFIISKVKNTVPWTYVISYLNDEPIDGTFYEEELQKTNQEKFRTERVIKRKGHKLYVKWEGYDNSFNSWINKKDLVWKWVNTFLRRLEVLEEILMLKLIFQIMQQKLNLKMYHTQYLQVLRLIN